MYSCCENQRTRYLKDYQKELIKKDVKDKLKSNQNMLKQTIREVFH